MCIWLRGMDFREILFSFSSSIITTKGIKPFTLLTLFLILTQDYKKIIADLSQHLKFVEQSRLCESLGELEIPLLKIGNKVKEGENSDSSINIKYKIKSMC